jgi:hypothetical protein
MAQGQPGIMLSIPGVQVGDQSGLMVQVVRPVEVRGLFQVGQTIIRQDNPGLFLPVK